MLKKIVYVDDMSYSVASVRNKLQKHYDIYPVQSAEGLFNLMRSITPDLIMLDIKMPGMNGFEALKILKSDPRHARIPVIFVTGRDDPNIILQAMGLGAADLLVKPFVDIELYKRIENQLSPEKKEEYLPAVLAVDDNPSMLKMINMLLRRQYKMHTLSRPETLTTLLQRVEPDLFLLDCNMPVLSGFDLVPIIRSFPKHTKTPIIFLTSDGTIDTLTMAINSHASDFIVKPVDETVLLEKLAAHTADYMILRSYRSIMG